MRRVSQSTRPDPSSGSVSRRMSIQKTRDTGAELVLRRALHGMGLRFRLRRRPVAGLRCTPDLVFSRAQLAVFVDGCFWHGCREHGSWPKANADWWRAKIEANRRRDAMSRAALVESGWRVVQVWEHEDPVLAAGRIAEALRKPILVYIPVSDTFRGDDKTLCKTRGGIPHPS